MAIKGLTDDLGPGGMRRLGILRKGAKKPERGPGEDLEYFRFDSPEPELMVAFNKAYPGKPKTVNIVFPFHTAEECFEAWMEDWQGGSLMHRCNGVRCVVWIQPDGTYMTTAKLKDGEKAPACKGGCVEVGRLTVIIPELGRLGTVTVLTGSNHDIRRLPKQLKIVEIMNQGTILGVPFVLGRRMELITMKQPPPKKGKEKEFKPSKSGRVPTWKSLLYLEPAPRITEKFLIAAEQRALPPATEEAESIEVEFEEVDESRIGPMPDETEPVNQDVETKRRAPRAATPAAALETTEQKAKRLALVSGAVRHEPDGSWTITEGDGEFPKRWRVRKNGHVECERVWPGEVNVFARCEEFAKGVADDPKFQCAHIGAVKFFVVESKRADEKAAAESAR